MGISREEYFKKNHVLNKCEDDFDKEINEIILRIREERIARGMSQEELAKKAEVSGNTVSRIETLVSVPTLKILLKMCKVLGVNLKIE